MPFDGLVLAAVRKELEDKLTGGRIERVYQPDKEELIISVHRPGARHRLLLSANAQNARAHLTTSVRENPSAPPLFCMVLRKHLEGGRINAFEQPGLERMLVIKVDSRDELGSAVQKHLICEIMGKHSNIILVDASTNLIIDGIKRYSHTVSRYREVLPGRSYLPPPSQNKLNPFLVDEEQFRFACLKAPLETTLPDLLQKRFEGLSGATCREILYRANLSPDITLNDCGDYELRTLWDTFQKVMNPASRGSFEPCLTADQKGRLIDFAAVNLNVTGQNQKFGKMNDLLDIFFAERVRLEKLSGDRGALLSHLNKEISRLERKLDLYAESLADTAGAEKLKLYGELITANLYRLNKGLDQVFLENYYKEGSPIVAVSLDPLLTPVQNSQLYFKKYLKAKNTRDALESRTVQTREELDYLEGVKTAVELATSLSELDEVRRELVEQGYLKQPPPRKESSKVKKEKYSPRPFSFHSSDGYQIFVGKNNKQNDYLTLKIAREDDVWMHAKHIPGAHVIIRTGGKELPSTTLEEAAGLAAFFSKGRGSKSVQVDYTLKKHVHKPRGARPGSVVYERHKTIIASPDEEAAERLKDPEPGQSDSL